MYLWLCWVFVSVRGLSPVAASGGHSSSQCTVLSLSRPLLLRSTGSRRAGSAIVAHGPSHSAACGTLPGQGPNPRPPHRQADSQPLRHQGSPCFSFLRGRKREERAEALWKKVLQFPMRQLTPSSEIRKTRDVLSVCVSYESADAAASAAAVL